MRRSSDDSGHGALRQIFLADMGMMPGGEYRRVGGYLLIEEIGRGASGRVYRALHQDLVKTVALKVMQCGGDEAGDDRRIQRFRREAQTAASLNHPGIVGVHDVGVDGDLHYIAMDLVEGSTLDQWLAAEPELDQRLLLLERVAAVIGDAHHHGVIHRDLKPRNILVEATPSGEVPQPVVIDFGLARAVQDLQITRTGTSVGTPGYMAPEQLRGEAEALSPRTDVFGLGVMLYEAVTGALPFRADSAEAVDRRCERGLSGWAPPEFADAPRGLWSVIRRCLEVQSQLRFTDGAEVAAALARVRRGEPEGAALELRGRRISAWLRRHRGLVISGMLIAAILFAAARPAQRWWTDRELLARAFALERSHKEVLARAGGVISDIERARYREPSDLRIDALIERLDAELVGMDDTTGVADLYRAWGRLLLGRSTDPSPFATVAADYPDNPLVPLMRGRWWLRVYADSVRWPGQDGLGQRSMRQSLQGRDLFETPAMLRALKKARAALDRAADSLMTASLVESRWIETLCRSCETYASGELEQAVTALSSMPPIEALRLDKDLLLALALTRTGDLDRAIEVASDLVRSKGDLLPAHRTLIHCYKFRGLTRLAEGRDGDCDDLSEALRLSQEFLPEEESGRLVAVLQHNLGRALYRAGEDGSGAWHAARQLREQLLEQSPDDVRLLTNLAGLLADMAERVEDGEAALDRALQASRRARELAPEHPTVALMSVTVRLLEVKRHRRDRTRDFDFELLRRDLDWVQERNPTIEVLHDQVVLCFLEAEVCELRGEDSRDGFEAALEAANLALHQHPDSVDIRTPRFSTLIRISQQRRLSRDEVHAAIEDATLIARTAMFPRPAPRIFAHSLDELRARVSPPEATAIGFALPQLWTLVVAVAPANRSAWISLSRAQRRLRLHTPEASEACLVRAVGTLDSLLSREPGHEEAQLELAMTLLQLATRHPETTSIPDDGLERAFEICELALQDARGEGSPLHPAFWIVRGLVDIAWGDRQAAESSFAEARQLVAAGRGGEALHRIERELWERVRVSSCSREEALWARRWAEVIADCCPERVECWRTLGVAQYRSGQAGPAAETLEGLRHRPQATENSSDLAWLALACQENGELEKARSWLKQMEAALDRSESSQIDADEEACTEARSKLSTLALPAPMSR